MAVTNTTNLVNLLTNIAEAIRAKTGRSDKLTLNQMPSEIMSIAGSTVEVPSYVKTEAKRVISAVKAKQRTNSFTIIALSDSHQLTGNENITNGNLHAAQGAKIIAEAINPDLCIHLGDYTNGNSSTTYKDGINEIKEIASGLADAFAGFPMMFTSGNHDNLSYSKTALANSAIYCMINQHPSGIVSDSESDNYGYIDFPKKKLRVIMLNTADASKEAISDNQKVWFMNALDLSEKDNASDWGILVLSHHPLDWGSIITCSNIINAYMSGTSYTIGNTTVDFSGKNKAHFIANIHGHTHCYHTDVLYTILTSGTGTTAIPNTLKISTPNTCFYRNNEYGNNNTTEYYGIEFGDTTTYNKTASSSNDTAFCVYVIDFDNKKIEALHYGAGIDRSLTYDGTPIDTGSGGETTPTYTNILDTVGFSNGKYSSEPLGTLGTDAAYFATGVIKWDTPKTTPLYIKGWTYNTSASHSRIYGSTTVNGSINSTYGYCSGARLSTHYKVEELSNGYVKLTALTGSDTTRYICISMPGAGDNVIMSFEEIE